MKEENIFRERQNFGQWLVIASFVICAGVLNYAFIGQIVLGTPFGNKPMPDLLLIVVTVIFLFLAVSLFFIRLYTVIDKDGVYYRLFPYHFRVKFIAWEQIQTTEVTKFTPSFAINGLGIHFGIGYTAYLVSGNKALKLVLTNNKKIYIGTRRPKELMDFLEKLDAERKQDKKLRPSH